MNFPSLSEIGAWLLARYTQLRNSLGGLVFVLGLLVVISIHSLLKLCKVPVNKQGLWLQLAQKAMQKIFRIAKGLWEQAVARSEEIDRQAETPEIAKLFAGVILEWKHQQLDCWLLHAGVTDPETRLRLIQAVVLYRRLKDLVTLWNAAS